MSLGSIFKTVGKLALGVALQAELAHGSGTGPTKMDLVNAALNVSVPALLQAGGHDPSLAPDLIQHGTSIVEDSIALAKAFKK